MIITCKKEIPPRWIILAILPWASFTYTWSVMGVVFLFSLKKFVDNPVGFTFILSLPSFTSMILGPCVSLASDRIWTRFGRRKPFLVPSWLGIVCAMALMPLMPNLGALVTVYMVFFFFTDLSTPLDPLKQEIIPPHERGRATGGMHWCNNLISILFYFVALGRFDDVTFMAGTPVVGESILYWSVAVLISVMVLVIMLGIKEADPKSRLVGKSFTFKNFFGALLDAELWPVYMLVFGWAAIVSNLGALTNLLYTDQWNYTKQDMGINVAVGGIFNIFIIGLLTVFADKLDRLKTYRILICLSVALNFSYFCYVTFVLPDQRPSLVEIIIFGESVSIIGLLISMVYLPLVYDYVRRNKMGAYAAGDSIVRRLTGLFTSNGLGLFIWGYSICFQPPAGEMTRVVWKGEAPQKEEVRALLRGNPDWSYPQNHAPAPAKNIVVNAWQANGTISNTGRCWEVRLRNSESEKLAQQKEEKSRELSLLLSEEKLLRDKAAEQMAKGQKEVAAATLASADLKNTRVGELNREIERFAGELAARATAFEKQVTTVLGSRLIADGDQILGAKIRDAVVIEFPIDKSPDAHRLERELSNLRREVPGLIDIRPLKTEPGYRLAVSAFLDRTTDPGKLTRELLAALEKPTQKNQHSFLAPGGTPLSITRSRALSLDLMVVEDPLDTYVSPINRAVNLVLDFFDAVPRPDRKLSAIASNLRSPTGINHIRIEPGPAPKTITVIGVVPSSMTAPAIAPDVVTRKLEVLLGPQVFMALSAREFYDRIEKSAATQRLTVARPVLTTGYAPLKYNYMSGYIWMLLMGIIGITITTVFSRLETRGLIRKQGVEEALQS